jgi:DNA-directed RNA polymerase specialized sigma24 family protein
MQTGGSDSTNDGKESKEFCALLRRGRRSHKLIDELVGSPLFMKRLMTLCLILTNFRESEAKDLRGEVCLKLCTVLPKFKPKYKRPYGNFFNWLNQVTRNTFFDSKRGLEFQFTMESIDDWDVPCLELDLVDHLDMVRRQRRLWEGMKRLQPDKKRWAVTLYIRGGYSTREVQEILKGRGIKCTHAAIANWVRILLCSVFPEAKDAILQLHRKPNAPARRRRKATSKATEDAEKGKSPAAVKVTKKRG